MLRLGTEVAYRLAAYLAEHDSIEMFNSFLSLSSFHRKLYIPRHPRHPSIWLAFLSENWVVTVVRKRVLAGTLPRCKVDELMEFFRYTEGKLPLDLDLLRIQVFSAVFPLFRILYPDYPLFLRRQKDDDINEAVGLLRGTDIPAARNFIVTYRVPAARVICSIVRLEHLAKHKELTKTDIDSIRMFTAAYSPLKKGDIPVEVLKYILILETQTPTWKRGGNAPELISVFPFDKSHSNQKFKIHCIARFLEWGDRDLLKRVKEATSVSLVEVTEALSSLEVLDCDVVEPTVILSLLQLCRRSIDDIKNYIRLLLDADLCIPVGACLVKDHRKEYEFLWAWINSDGSRFSLVEDDLVKFIGLFTHDKVDPANATAIGQAIIAFGAPLSDKVVAPVVGTPLENLIHQIRNAVNQKAALSQKDVDGLVLRLEDTRREVENLRDEHTAVLKELETLVAKKRNLENAIVDRSAQRDGLSKGAREVQYILTTPRFALVQEVLNNYIQSFTNKKRRRMEHEGGAAGKRSRQDSRLGTEEVTAAHNLLNLHQTRQATAGGP